MAEGSRVVLVTGAARGIGRAIVERQIAAGWRAALLDRSAAALEETVAALNATGGVCRGFVCDVADEAAVARAMADVDAAFGRLDGLVNNAGGAPADGKVSRVADMDIAEWSAVVGANLTGAFLLSRAAIPLMRRNGFGRIVNISSMGGRTRSLLSGAHYGAAKAGLLGFSRVLAGELGRDAITVNCVAPGRIATAQSDAFGGLDAFLAQLPLGRLGTPDEIAAAVGFLLSEEAGYMTGAILDVNGGHFMP